MRINEEMEMDHLRDLITPQRVEKASDGFTDRVMASVRLEPLPSARRKERIRSIVVPAAFGLIFVSLIIIALLTGSSEKSQMAVYIDKISGVISQLLPSRNILPEASIPRALVYIPLGILALALLDSAIIKLRRRKAVSR
ncbi:MAG TPA: hypothetical protein VMT63_02440 [Bacteroidales bacterium]|nr:hypothetical protein [Bacteroidales bacterium]